MNQRQDILNFRKTNKLALIILWLVLFFGGLPQILVDNFEFGGALTIWGIGFLIFFPATIIYFKNKNSSLIRYFISCGSVIVVYSILYVQQGTLDNLFWIPACLAASSIFFDRLAAAASALISIIIAVLLYFIDHQLFFPKFGESQFMVYCIALAAIGLFFVAQGDYGRKLIFAARQQSNELNQLYGRLQEVFMNIAQTSKILDDNISGIRNEALNVKEEASQITLSIEQFGAAIEQTAKLSSQSNSALAAINDLIQKTSGQSGDLVTVAALAYETANEGKSVIAELVDQVQILEESVNATSEIVELLSIESKKINEIIVFINDITKKTNLLALNASIEASRVGSVGEGFMVIAGEMKSFAEQTAGALGGITKILGDITAKITAVQTQITKGELAVKDGIDKTNITFKYFGNITQKINEIKTNTESVIRDITALVKESTVVFSNLSQIITFTEQSVNTAGELTGSSSKQSEHIDGIEKKLTDLVVLSSELKAMIAGQER